LRCHGFRRDNNNLLHDAKIFSRWIGESDSRPAAAYDSFPRWLSASSLAGGLWEPDGISMSWSRNLLALNQTEPWSDETRDIRTLPHTTASCETDQHPCIPELHLRFAKNWLFEASNISAAIRHGVDDDAHQGRSLISQIQSRKT
jgi:hypothetical protein